MFAQKNQKPNNKKRVFVGLSGGVDSAVSATLLQQDGYDVTGVFIRIALPGYPCSAAEDKVDAQRVAAHLRIPFIEIDLSEEYKKEVFDNAIGEFAKGNTPNPDTLCNQKIKFGAFYAFAKSRGADFIATGHYAQIQNEQGSTLLKRGADDGKDQSYFLWMVPETVLRFTRFPVGDRTKKEVRRLARTFGLPNAARKDSQGLCFLGGISVDDMVRQEIAPTLGDVLDEGGAVVGTHRGAVLYTLGQRHGFELFVQTGAPHFVVAKNVQKNTITVSLSPLPRGISKTTLTLAETNWIGKVQDGTYDARFRYRQTVIPSELKRGFRKPPEGGLRNPLTEVVLTQPHFAPAGQSLVLYEGERCIGGGIIEAVLLT